jgi:hypothetical protein
MRRAVLVLALLGVVATCAWAAHSYLTSGRAAEKVSAQLASLYDGPLQLDAVDIGIAGSSVSGLRFFEAEGGAPEPWLTVEHASADLSLWNLLADNPMPGRLDLDGALLRLRFDAAGRLLTRIPAQPSAKQRAWPSLNFHNCTVAIQQLGRAEFTVHGVEASLKPDQGTLVAKGTVADSYWGTWTLSGKIDPQTGRGESLLATERTDVSMAKLQAIPFVSPNLWEQVHVDAQTTVQLRLVFDPAAGSWKYRVEMHPEQAKVYVKAITLQSDRVEGKVIVEDGQVTLKELHGMTADGGIATNAQLDFRRPLREMTFAISVYRVDTHRLPKEWRLPVLVGGRLTGNALLKVTVGGEPHVLTTGEGKGRLNDRLPVHMIADVTGFHFSL